MKQLIWELILEDMLANFMAKLSCLYILDSADIINYTQIPPWKKKKKKTTEINLKEYVMAKYRTIWEIKYIIILNFKWKNKINIPESTLI